MCAVLLVLLQCCLQARPLSPWVKCWNVLSLTKSPLGSRSAEQVRSAGVLWRAAGAAGSPGCPGCCCGASLLSPRACWSRVFAMALFVEHVLLGIRALMPEFEGLVKKYTLLLAKVSKAAISPLPSSADRGNSALRCGSSVTGPCPFPLQCFQHDSDMKSHPTFVAVLTVLCQCKNEVSSRLHRYWHWLQSQQGHCQHTCGNAARVQWKPGEEQ